MSLYYQNVDMTSESEDPQPARGGLPQIPRGRHDQPRHGGGRGHRDSYCVKATNEPSTEHFTETFSRCLADPVWS